MEITDIILVINNEKGTETNCLMTINDYKEFMSIVQMDSKEEIANLMLSLGRTVGEEYGWAEHYFASNKTVFAKYCMDEEMLEYFLQGNFNERDLTWRFDENLCSKECLDKLKQIGMDIEGWSSSVGFHYEKVEQEYHTGDILKNLNRRRYRVMEKFSPRNLLLMDIKSGNFLVGVNVATFARCPEGEEMTDKNKVVGIEWGHGVYLPDTLSNVNFRMLRQEYGEPEKIEDLSDYRYMLRERFNLYHSLSKDDLASESIRAAATNSMYDEFGTGRPDTFMDHLEDGRYDGGFNREKATAKERGGR